MAVLVTVAEVQEIIDTTLTEPSITAYISAADSVVQAVLGTDTTLTANHKKEIEQWLAAHLIASTQEPQISKAEAGGASVTYQGVTGKGLESTLYGQQVLIMDTTGKMRQIEVGGKFASLSAITSFA